MSVGHVEELRRRQSCTPLRYVLDRLVPHSDLSRPPQGGYNPPSFHATPPNHLKFKGGYQGGVSGGCLRDRDGRGNKRGQILT